MPRDTYLAWDTAANKRITAYLMRHSKRLFPDAVYDPSIRGMKVGPISCANELVIRSFRNSWAEDMREGPVPDDQGEAWWLDAMERAEAEIARTGKGTEGLSP